MDIRELVPIEIKEPNKLVWDSINRILKTYYLEITIVGEHKEDYNKETDELYKITYKCDMINHYKKELKHRAWVCVGFWNLYTNLKGYAQGRNFDEYLSSDFAIDFEDEYKDCDCISCCSGERG